MRGLELVSTIRCMQQRRRRRRGVGYELTLMIRLQKPSVDSALCSAEHYLVHDAMQYSLGS
jgi:hypothetical protein